jgi:hypothetical protein
MRVPPRTSIASGVVVLLLLAVMLPVAALGASRPPGFVRACGSITNHGKRLRIDIGEGDGKLISCPHARSVMRRFLRTHQRGFRSYGQEWGCYKSRPDGQGWDYHCLSIGTRYVDVAGGRRW